MSEKPACEHLYLQDDSPTTTHGDGVMPHDGGDGDNPLSDGVRDEHTAASDDGSVHRGGEIFNEPNWSRGGARTARGNPWWRGLKSHIRVKFASSVATVVENFEKGEKERSSRHKCWKTSVIIVVR